MFVRTSRSRLGAANDVKFCCKKEFDDMMYAAGSPVPSLKLELERVAPPEPFYAVPHRTGEVRDLVGGAVGVYWEQRRYGESWDNLTPPDSYYGESELERIG